MFKPMLAQGKIKLDKLPYPLIVQKKLDGIRASVVGGQLVSRTLKPIPNAYVRGFLSHPEYEGLDGELIVGDPTDPDCFRTTTSAIMREDGKPEFRFYAFDFWKDPLNIGQHPNPSGYRKRWREALDVATYQHRTNSQFVIKILDYVEVFDPQGLENAESAWVAEGYEGVIVRSPDTPYKFGRGSTTKFELGKIKRFEDFEAVVLDVYEEQENLNVAVKNALGRTERSSHQDGKIGKHTLGGLICQRFTVCPDSGTVQRYGPTFRVGTGFNRGERIAFWHGRAGLLGKFAKIKSFPVGEHERPRFPVFLGLRDSRDMS